MTSYSSANSNNPAGHRDGIVLQGYHKKLKTMKKKYFVLCSENGVTSSRLEYYDSEKKFKSRSNPKRMIILKNCFNINRRLDTKHNCVIALSTKEEVFCIVLETEGELNEWLKALLALQRGEDTDSDQPKPFFEHVWQVQMQRKGLAEEKGIIGKYYVCLTAKSLTLVRIGSHATTIGESRLTGVEFYLTTIRRCGDSQCFFYMEVGRHSAIGAGELWMQTEDPLIAQNMHTMIINAMSSTKNLDDGFCPISRKRSSSANEASKPISMTYRRQTLSGNKGMNSSPLSESPSATSSTISSTSTVIQTPIIKPSTSKALDISQTPVITNSLNSTTNQQHDLTNHQQSALSASSCCSTTRVTPVITSTSCNPQYPFTAPMRFLGSQRRHSVSAMSSVCHQRTLSLPNGDPILAINILSGTNNSTKLLNHITATNNQNDDSTINQIHNIQPVHQRTRSLPLTEETAIQMNQINSQSTVTRFKQNLNNNNYNNSNLQCTCNLVAKIHYKNCPMRLIGKVGGSSLSFFSLSSASSSSTSSSAINNNNHIVHSNLKKKLSSGVPIVISGSSVGSGDCTAHSSNINNGGESHNEMNNNVNNGGSSIIGTNSMECITEDPNALLTTSDIQADVKNIQNFIMKNNISNGKYPKNSPTTTTTTIIALQNSKNMKSNSGTSPSLPRRGRNIRSSRSTTLGRERCDSLPSRNRTASECSNNQIIINSSMPPPIRPTLSNRPHSMYTNRHSHSPPLNTLSPSTGCSESDGSSLSIDEPDSFGHSLTPDESGNFVGRYYNTHSSGGVIPEENCDDLWYLDKRNSSKLDNLNNISGRLTLPISTNHSVHNMRKSSPATSHIGSADMQSQYMDMFSPYSPSGSSPCDQPGSGFMPVSPGTDFPRGLYTGSSGGHSRASSLAEETVDGYVPMCPPQLPEYVDMEQSTKQHHVSGLSSAASSCSITSGTPSTDLRFAEYPLDKVKSRFTPDDEDLHPANERPIRAYSVGSRPEHIKRKLRVEALNNTAEQNNSRVRAFSVGSRAKVPRCDLYRGVFAPSLISCHANNNNNNNNNNIETIIASTVAAAGKSKKSSSAPILVHKSQSSVDRMSDLMEIDFSKNSEHLNDSSNSSHSQPSPVRLSSFPLSVPITQQKRDFFENSPKSSSGYLAMKPASYTDKSTPIGQKSMDSSGYLEMRPISATKNSSLSSSPIKASTSVPKSIVSVCEDSSYINMSPSTSLTSSETRRIDTEDYMNVSPHDQHMDMDCYITNSTNTPEGYIEMNWKRLSRCNDNETITNTGSGEFNRRCGEIRTGRELRNVSSPIDIKSKDNKSSGLTLSEAFSKLPRRTDSRESDIVTPIASHTNTIFPFSPGSPVKPFAQNDFASKCLVDATSGTVTLSEDNSNLSPSINQNASVTTAIKKLNTIAPDNTKILNTDSKMPKKYAGNLEALSNDYADMSLGSRKIKTNPKKNPVEKMECSDYVNYVPPEKTVVTKPIKINSDRDYAIMNQKATTSRKVTPVIASTSSSTLADVSFTNKKHLLVTVGNGPNESTSNFTGFRPIASSTDESFLRGNSTRKASSPKSGITSHLNRQLSDKSRNIDENSSGYELLQMRSDSSLQTKKSLPRPNSVNSEKISPSKTVNRPNSANSECMPSISTSSSTSTLCGSSSSSSTLCGSKSQSPLACSRLQSFSDPVVPSGSTSRPESVSSIADPSLSSRPPSVSSERGLYYASLDLPPSTSNIISTSNNIDSQQNTAISSSNSLAKGNSSTSGDSSTSPSPNANGCQQQPTFTYAQIDFNKCESLKMAINAGNNQ